MRTILLTSFLFLAGAGCTHQEPRPTVVSAPLPSEGKRAAPVAIDAELGSTHAKLTLRFQTAGENVSVGVSGLDGLKLVTPSALLGEGKVTAGEVRVFDVDFSSSGARSNLAVEVRGTFNGAPLGRVVTFVIGDGPLPQTGTRVVTDDGDAIKVMK